jgi:hypothetical protein
MTRKRVLLAAAFFLALLPFNLFAGMRCQPGHEVDTGEGYAVCQPGGGDSCLYCIVWPS